MYHICDTAAPERNFGVAPTVELPADKTFSVEDSADNARAT
jgi:hypothetical protein